MQVVADAMCCVDCLMLAVNGEEANAEHTEAYRKGTQGLGDPCMKDDEDEGSFSWSPCQICGSHLGGQRFDVIWLG